jgi:hypothetical protein
MMPHTVPERLLELRDLLRRGAFHGALDVLDAAEIGRHLVARRRLALRARDPNELLIAGAEHLRDRARLQVEARSVDRGQVLRVPEDVDETLGLALGAPHLATLREDDRPAHDREPEQEEQDELNDRARPGDHVDDGLLRPVDRKWLSGLTDQPADSVLPHAHLTAPHNPFAPSRATRPTRVEVGTLVWIDRGVNYASLQDISFD